MFHTLQPALKTFRGYRIQLFRQGRCNLAERTLTTRVVRFAPPLGRVGVFLPAGETGDLGGADPRVRTGCTPDLGEVLEAAWRANGCPPVKRPTTLDALLFGEVVPIRPLEYAGCDDLWCEGDTLICASKRRHDPDQLATRLATYEAATLQAAAEAQLANFLPHLPRAPKRIIVHPLRPRILGQCTRDGEIRLNRTLLRFPPEILAETLAHELTHLTHFNHSPAFWRALTQLLPDWLPRSLAHYL